jgi:hypothetical protein
MIHSTVNAKGELVIHDDDGKKMTKKALAQQGRERRQVETRHRLGLYITQDKDGTRHFWRGDDEVTEDQWMQQHPHMKGKVNGRDGSSDSGNLGIDGECSGADGPDAEVAEQVRRKERFKRYVEESNAVKDGVGEVN